MTLNWIKKNPNKSALLCLIFVVVIIIIAINVNNNQISNFNGGLQPLLYPLQYFSIPDNCFPYSGCMYPSENPNSLKTGKEIPPSTKNDIWCKIAWRDCNAYQDCINGKCLPKSVIK